MVCWRRKQTFDIAGASHILFGIIEHLGPIVPLVDDFVGKGPASGMVPQLSLWIFFIALLTSSDPRHLKYGSECILEYDFLYKRSPMSMYLVAMCCSFCTSAVAGHRPVLQIGNDVICPSWRGVEAKISLSGSWMLGFTMCSTWTSRLNWNSVTDARLGKDQRDYFRTLGLA